MLNRIVLVGRLTKDPDSKYTPNGIAICQFRIAVDRPTKDPETGEKQTDFFDIVAWRRTAEFVTQYVTKGRLVAVDGRLQTRSWVAQDGSKRTAYEVNADTVQALDRAQNGGDAGAQPAQSGYADRQPANFDLNDENDPFADD
jgi:single-strand DNA-binding protein